MTSLYCQVEPELLPIERDGTPTRCSNTADKARLDVAGVGVWGDYEKTFWCFDISAELHRSSSGTSFYRG